MTVRELLALLGDRHLDERVVVNGYEFGFDDVVGVRSLRLALGVHAQGYAGPHEDADDCEWCTECTGNVVVPAALLVTKRTSE